MIPTNENAIAEMEENGTDKCDPLYNELEIATPVASVSLPAGDTPGEEKASDLLAFNEYRGALRARLEGPVGALTAEATGVHLQVAWHRPFERVEPHQKPILCPIARERMAAAGQLDPQCERCLKQQWEPVFLNPGQERQFRAECGMTNVAVCLVIENTRQATLVLQAGVSALCSKGVPKSEGLSKSKLTSKFGTLWRKITDKGVSQEMFSRAIILMRLIKHDLESTTQALGAKKQSDYLAHKLSNSEYETRRLQGKLHRLSPGTQDASPPLQSDHSASLRARSRPSQLVDTMLHYAKENYHRPISLSETAADMKMNASYLSDLFSQTTGVTFHAHLNDLRFTKAKALLCDPKIRICEVSELVGYATPDSFRHAFKHYTGTSPRTWLENHGALHTTYNS